MVVRHRAAIYLDFIDLPRPRGNGGLRQLQRPCDTKRRRVGMEEVSQGGRIVVSVITRLRVGAPLFPATWKDTRSTLCTSTVCGRLHLIGGSRLTLHVVASH